MSDVPVATVPGPENHSWDLGRRCSLHVNSQLREGQDYVSRSLSRSFVCLARVSPRKLCL